MRNSANLATHVIVEPIERVGVDEAVADPETGSDALGDLVEDGEGVFDAVLGEQLARVLFGLGYRLGVVLEDVEALLACDCHLFAVLRPEDELGCDFDAADELGVLPFEEWEAANWLDA